VLCANGENGPILMHPVEPVASGATVQ
jgi:hypothetical protein